MTLTPEKRSEIAELVAQGYADRLKRTLDGLDDGILFWSKGPPAARLAEYNKATLPEERMLILIEDYAKLVATGQVEVQSQMWSLLAQLPEYEFEKWAGDYRRLWREAQRRETSIPLARHYDRGKDLRFRDWVP